ncbi:hypothetical protein [Boudabousia marimammalium]|uniref:hypothetical protein n=1 Tax=Boudabousia marimammalium TaxID=156892 RepID=UPI000A7AF554|nr:hypothetical protein [Boudabousia marimammalium]
MKFFGSSNSDDSVPSFNNSFSTAGRGHPKAKSWMPTPVVAVLIAICVFFGVISVVTDVVDQQLAFVSFLSYSQPWRFVPLLSFISVRLTCC